MNSTSTIGITPVHTACIENHFDVIKILVENNADINKPDIFGKTCLMTSIDNIEILKFLLDHGAMVNVKDEQKKTALQYAIENEKWEAAEILKCYGATPFQRDFNDIFSLEQLFELKTACCNTPTSKCHGWICSLSTPTHTLLI